MDRKKIFGVSANTNLKNSYDVNCCNVSSDYTNAIQLAGGVPLILPPLNEVSDVTRQLDVIDVLIISGGEDVHPSHYGEEPSPLLEEVSPERDLHELQLIKLAFERKIPIMGICRGLQIINVAFGGSLYQDVSQLNTPIDHSQQAPRHEASHLINVEENSLLYRIVEVKTLEINSFHHQGIKRLASPLVANAYASDGLIEGIEMDGEAPLLAVQWHPEMMVGKDPMMLKLFKYFTSLAPIIRGGG